MMNIVVDKMAEILAAQPDSVLPLNDLGMRKPSRGSEVPAVVISLVIDDYKGIGIGRFVRSGDSVVQNTSILEVISTSEMFTSNLKSLRISPLPIKRNPSSTRRNLTEQDVRVHNVTDPSAPIPYRLVNEPTRVDEYQVDVPRAQIIFGQAQQEGDKLEVAHWTLTWRDEILGTKYNGTVSLEIWATSFDQADTLSRNLQVKLRSNPSLQRSKGFLNLRPTRLEPIENVLYDPPIGSPFDVWTQRLDYRFVFEAKEGGEMSSGIPIQRIDIDIDEHIEDVFSVP